MAKTRQLYAIEIGTSIGRNGDRRWSPWEATTHLRTARRILRAALEHDGPGSHRIVRYVPLAGEGGK